jgi:hypothetical protein
VSFFHGKPVTADILDLKAVHFLISYFVSAASLGDKQVRGYLRGDASTLSRLGAVATVTVTYSRPTVNISLKDFHTPERVSTLQQLLCVSLSSSGGDRK